MVALVTRLHEFLRLNYMIASNVARQAWCNRRHALFLAKGRVQTGELGKDHPVSGLDIGRIKLRHLPATSIANIKTGAGFRSRDDAPFVNRLRGDPEAEVRVSGFLSPVCGDGSEAGEL
jgi:hypothetical protein